MTDKNLATRAGARIVSAGRGGWPRWAAWMAAFVVFVVDITSAPEIYDFDKVEGGLLPLIAASAALPAGLIISRPLIGWLIASVTAVTFWAAIPILDGDPWSMPIIHGLVILASLLVIVWSPLPERIGHIHPGIGIIAWLGTVAVFGVLAASDIRAGWIVAVTGVAAVGAILRLLGIKQQVIERLPDEGLTDWKQGFREAFMGWPTSAPTGAPLGERFLGNPEWLNWARTTGPWILGVAVFAMSLADVNDNFEIHSLALPFTAMLIALPVALIGNRVLIGWRIITVLALVFAVVGTPLRDGYVWPSSLEFVWLGVVFLVSIRHSRTTTIWVWLATVLSMSAGYGGRAEGAEGTTTSLIAGMTALVFIGDLIRSRRSAAQSLEEQTELSELEKARRAVLEEKARIARDLHDVVAHHMSMVAVQAESAPYRLSGLDDDTKAEFSSISASAREALGEIRGLLGVLRSDTDDIRHAPQPGFAEIRELVRGSRRSGVSAELLESGDTSAIGSAVGLSAYRIVQESLANAARHAPGSAVTARIDVRDDQLLIQVTNTAAPRQVKPSTPGHGIVGMRERAAVVGGTLHAGPVPDGGWEVVATLPVTPDETAEGDD